jgi:hypothetical protein
MGFEEIAPVVALMAVIPVDGEVDVFTYDCALEGLAFDIAPLNGGVAAELVALLCPRDVDERPFALVDQVTTRDIDARLRRHFASLPERAPLSLLSA